MNGNDNTGLPQSSRFWTEAQSGQAIVLLMLALVVLIGFTGLAIDGGGLFFLQRDAQNATDAAVLAATYARCTGANPDDVVAAGIAAAAENGFHNGRDGRIVEVYNPPLHGEKADAPDADSYIEVNISATKPAYFIQVVYQGPLQVTTYAVGYCLPPFDPTSLPAITGLSSTCTNTVRWAGSTSEIRGGVFSNNDMQFTGSDNTIEDGADAVTHVDSPSSNNNTFSPASQDGAPPLEGDPLANFYRIEDYAPDPLGAVARNAPIYHPITQGNNASAPYYDVDFKDANGRWEPKNRTLEGLYYVDGDVALGNNITFGPNGISIVATGKISGNAVNATYYQYPGSTGVLFFSNTETGCGPDAISMSGETQWHGLIYAPHGGVSVSGDHLTLIGVIVAQTVTMDASDMLLVGDPSVLPPRPPLVKIAE